jgi:hypothetical protein
MDCSVSIRELDDVILGNGLRFTVNEGVLNPQDPEYRELKRCQGTEAAKVTVTEDSFPPLTRDEKLLMFTIPLGMVYRVTYAT